MKGAALAFAAALSACKPSGDNRICGTLAPPISGEIPKTANEQSRLTMSCVERWAARLSASPDSAGTVADAVMSACDGAIDILHNMAERENSPVLYGDAPWWRRHALFIIVQTRAGKCYPDA